MLIKVLPEGKDITVKKGAVLLDALTDAGIEVPVLCNRNGVCGKCKVIVRAKANHPLDIERVILGQEAIQRGFRLACKCILYGEGTVSIPVPERLELMETAESKEITKIKKGLYPYSVVGQIKQGLYIAIDMGTTTLSGYLIDGDSTVISHLNLLNPTTLYGADVITLLGYIQQRRDGFKKIRSALLSGIIRVISALLEKSGKDAQDVIRIGVCGNTVIQNIFLGLNPVEIGLYPYRAPRLEAFVGSLSEIGGFKLSGLSPDVEVMVPPAVSGFIGGDVICGLLYTGLLNIQPALYIDLGTNGEIVLNAGERVFAGSSSAGPAFEAFKIGCGMRAAVGAIESVRIKNKDVFYTVIGGVQPSGLCGTGIVSAISSLIRIGSLEEKGHIKEVAPIRKIHNGIFVVATGSETATSEPISITDRDVEVVQQAKAAFATGVKIMLSKAGLKDGALKGIYIAGAFGSRLSPEDIKDIGILPYGIKGKIETVGNAAGAGLVNLILSDEAFSDAVRIAKKIDTIQFSNEEGYEDLFIDNLFFRRTHIDACH